ncbi:hypothetical protein C8J56DRAFT_895931 [Mycena floridula]|nr:hypothetical protein C8J56DRAFT_895931 [Mycena floridula]
MGWSPTDVLLLVDAPALSLAGPGWFTEQPGPVLVGGTQYICNGEQSYCSFAYNFTGTGISFTGNTPASSDTNSPKIFDVAIDYNPSYASTFQYPAGVDQWYAQFYESPDLLDGPHSINLSSIVTGLDYAVITAGPSTPLLASTILVDDDNAEIIFTGQGWQRNTDILKVMPNVWLDSLPVGNATHSSRTVGDSFTFQFAGTSLALYGVFDWTSAGKLSTVFTLDGKNTPMDFITPSGPALFQQQNHYPIFAQSNLDAGNHTLTVAITYADGDRSFVLDYICYVPSFSSLASKPQFPPLIPPDLTNPSTSNTTSPVVSSSPDPLPVLPKKSHVGAVAGALAGVLILLVVTILGVFIVRRHRYRKKPRFIQTRDDRPSLIFEPFDIQFMVEPFMEQGAPPLAPKSRVPASEMTPNVAVVDAPGALGRTAGSEDDTRIQIAHLNRRVDELAKERVLLGVPPPVYSV